MQDLARLLMIVEGISYEFIKASDVIRDGVAFECWKDCAVGGNQGALVAEAFWHDPTGRFTIRVFEQDLPFVLMEAFLREAARWCSPRLKTDAGTRTLIYVPLLHESVAVWRPVLGELTDGEGYRIIGENLAPSDEAWAFNTGEVVRCEERQFSDGSVGLVAIQRAC